VQLTGVVGDATELGSTLSGSEGLPPRSISGSSMLSGPIHEVGRVLIRTEEEDFGVFSARNIDNGALDTWRLTGNEQIDDRLAMSASTLH
jgi:hypothetical protein